MLFEKGKKHVQTYVAQSLQNCQYARVVFAKSSTFLENLTRVRHQKLRVCAIKVQTELVVFDEQNSSVKVRKLP
uniref:Putative ovule protein n=1 Tax=Solanum chacoense TaxID=4108 RepID=A0A0V0HC17_SOLCH